MGKVAFFLTTGRTGTKKLAAYFGEFSPPQVAVDHQTRDARIINILANMHYHGFPVNKSINSKIHTILMNHQDNEYYINCDPLLSFALSCVDFTGFDVRFIHIERKVDDFARSMINWQFTKMKSYVAHNFVPFWQPDIWPFEHMVHLYNKVRLRNKYREVWGIKNRCFEIEFREKHPYLKIKFEELFDPKTGGHAFQRLVDFIGIEIDFCPDVFFQKENASASDFSL